MKKCEGCGSWFIVSEAKDQFRSHLIELGWENYLGDKMGYFDSDYCGDCNESNFLEQNQGEDYDYEFGGGEYRTYGEYLASGGPVDPCSDALWLHDQE